MFQFYESSRTREKGRTAANIYLQLKWDLSNYENHRFNVKNAKTVIDDKPPRDFSHLYCRPKKLQLELERFAKIQRANKSLMQRISTIQREGAWTKNKNFYEIKSLNTRKRQMEMVQLCYDNQVMVQRIVDVHPVHIASKYEDEYLEFKKHKANVQKYSKDWRHGVLQMKLLQKHIRNKVYAYRTGRYKPEMNLRVTRMALKKEATEHLRREMEAEAEKKAEEKRRAHHKALAHLAKELKHQEEDRKSNTQKWRDSRAEILKRIQQEKEEKEKLRKAEKLQQNEARKKRTTAAKQRVEQWKSLHEEEKEELQKKKLEERRKKIEEEKSKANAVEEKRRKKLAEWKEKKMMEEEKRKEDRAMKEKQEKEDLHNRIRDIMGRRGVEFPGTMPHKESPAESFYSANNEFELDDEDEEIVISLGQVVVSGLADEDAKKRHEDGSKGYEDILEKREGIRDDHEETRGKQEEVLEEHEDLSEGHEDIPEESVDLATDHEDSSEKQKNILEEHGSIPEELENIPDDHESIPEDLEEITPEHVSITKELQNISEEHGFVPGEPENISEEHESVPEELEEITPEHISITKELENIPEEHGSVTEELEDIPEEQGSIPEELEEIPEELEGIPEELSQETNDEETEDVTLNDREADKPPPTEQSEGDES